MRYLPILILVLLLTPAAAQAHTMRSVKYACPVDGTEFTAFLTGSDTTRGMMLDLQPIGMGTYPWPVGQCPADGMVMYKNDFTPEEIAILKEYVPSPEYQAAAGDPAYWKIAKLKEKLGVPLNERWFAMVQATWQAHSQYESYARETIAALETLLADPENRKEKDVETWQLLRGELYRRIGDFDQAKTIFEEMKTRPEFKNHDFYPSIINYELELIAAGDKSSHRVPN